MLLLLLLLMLPAAVFAQHSFGPLRLDDSTYDNYYYPRLIPDHGDAVLCLWSGTSAARLTAYGQRFATDGIPLSLPLIYEEQGSESYRCAASVNIVPLSNGGEARLVAHS
jgi:hypothetical protein